MKTMKKLLAFICILAIVLASQETLVLASAEAELAEALLYVRHSRLLLNGYSDLAIAKEDVKIYNENDEVVGILNKDAAANILAWRNEEAKCEILSGEIRGLVESEQLLTGKMAEIRAVTILDEKAIAESKKLTFEKKEFKVKEGEELVGFEIKMDGILDEAKPMIAKAETVENEKVVIGDHEAIEEENDKKEEEVVSKRKIKYSKADLDLLAAIIYCESGNQSRQGKLAVANVILNRVEDKRFPNTIKGVIYAPRQFSPAGNGKLKRTLKNKAPKSCYNAALAALEGENNVEGYLYFDGRIHQGGYKKIGAHYFWKKPW